MQAPDEGHAYLEPVAAAAPLTYWFLKEEEVRVRWQALISNACALFPMPLVHMHYLLRAHHWTLDSMAERITVDHEGLLAAFERAGFVPCTMRAAPPVLPTGQATVPCSICLNSVSINEVFAPNPCGHLFCNECWRFCIKSRINDGTPCSGLTCMQKDCKVLLSEELVKELIKDDAKVMDRFDAMLASLYSDSKEGNSTIKVCPKADCKEIIYCTSPEEVIRCFCGARWCFRCHSAEIGDHRPASCENVRVWVSKETEMSDANWTWIRENTKQCPKCGVRIEKTQGCMHVKCIKCKHEFCWLCKGLWKGHKKPGCNRYVSERNADMHLFFYLRFDSWKAAYASASARIAQLERLLPSTPAQVARGQMHFAVAAWQELLENRRVLQWSYAFGYCHDKSRTNERELLEFCQGVLEDLTEKLSKLLETSPLTHQMSDLLAYKNALSTVTETCSTYRRRFVEKVSQGLTGTPLAPLPTDADTPTEAMPAPTGEEEVCPLCFIPAASGDGLYAHMLGMHPEVVEGHHEAGTCDRCTRRVIGSRRDHDLIYHPFDAAPVEGDSKGLAAAFLPHGRNAALHKALARERGAAPSDLGNEAEEDEELRQALRISAEQAGVQPVALGLAGYVCMPPVMESAPVSIVRARDGSDNDSVIVNDSDEEPAAAGDVSAAPVSSVDPLAALRSAAAELQAVGAGSVVMEPSAAIDFDENELCMPDALRAPPRAEPEEPREPPAEILSRNLAALSERDLLELAEVLKKEMAQRGIAAKNAP